MSVIRELLTEGNSYLSLGSLCMAFITLVWTIQFMWCTFSGCPLIVPLDQLAIFCGTVYAVKKVPPLVFRRNKNESDPDNS